VSWLVRRGFCNESDGRLKPEVGRLSLLWAASLACLFSYYVGVRLPLLANLLILGVNLWSLFRLIDATASGTAHHNDQVDRDHQVLSQSFGSRLWRERYWIFAAMALLGLYGFQLFHQASEKERVATQGYLNVIDFTRRELKSTLLNEPWGEDLKRSIARCEQNVSAYRAAALAISDIPSQHADPTVVELASKEIAYYNRAALTYEAVKAWLEQVEGLKAHSESWGAMLESLLRGFSGDPFGKTNELFSEQGQLKVAFRSTVQPKAESLMAERTTLMTETSQLRMLLSKKFGVDIPQMADVP
jgi:hypothetical protein